jgi:hypothetical protein
MKAVLLALVAASSFPADKLGEAERTVVAVAKMVDGEVRGLLVHKGMTQEEVERLLGRERVMFFAPADPKPLILYCYYKRGVYVHYSSDESDVLRADRVNCSGISLSVLPLFR